MDEDMIKAVQFAFLIFNKVAGVENEASVISIA